MSDVAQERHDAPPRVVEVDSTVAPELVVSIFVALAGLGAAFLDGLLVGVATIVVAGATVGLSWQLARDGQMAAVAGAASTLFVTHLDVAVFSLILLGAITLAAYLRAPLLAASVGAGVLLAGPFVGWALALAAAFLAIARNGVWAGLPSWTGPALGIVVVVGAAAFGMGPVALVAYLAGLMGRYVDLHPQRMHVGRFAAHTGPWLAALPAAALFLAGALDRLPAVEPVRLLWVAWGTVGLGGAAWLLALAGTVVLSTRSESGSLLLWGGVATVAALPVAAWLGDFSVTGRWLAAAWPLAAVLLPFGLRRVGRSVPVWRGGTAALFGLALLMALGLRPWLG